MAHENAPHHNQEPEKATLRQAKIFREALDALAHTGKRDIHEYSGLSFWSVTGVMMPEKAAAVPDAIRQQLPEIPPNHDEDQYTVSAFVNELSPGQTLPDNAGPESFAVMRQGFVGGVSYTSQIEYELGEPSPACPSGLRRRASVTRLPLLTALGPEALGIEAPPQYDANHGEQPEAGHRAVNEPHVPTSDEQALDDEINGVGLQEASSVIGFIRQCTTPGNELFEIL